MLLDFNLPVKKSNFYLVKPSTDILLELSNVEFRMKYNINNKLYYRFYIVEKSDREILSEIETQVRDVVVERNKEWFKNTLTDREILERYDVCYDDQTGLMDVLYMDSYPAIIKGEDSDMQSIVIRMLGVCIGKNNYSVKWLLREMENTKVDIPFDDVRIEWETKIDRLEIVINKKIDKLVETKKEMKKCYEEKDWNNLAKCVENIYD